MDTAPRPAGSAFLGAAARIGVMHSLQLLLDTLVEDDQRADVADALLARYSPGAWQLLHAGDSREDDDPPDDGPMWTPEHGDQQPDLTCQQQDDRLPHLVCVRRAGHAGSHTWDQASADAWDGAAAEAAALDNKQDEDQDQPLRWYVLRCTQVARPPGIPDDARPFAAVDTADGPVVYWRYQA
jgi:hypothetical protein